MTSFTVIVRLPFSNWTLSPTLNCPAMVIPLPFNLLPHPNSIRLKEEEPDFPRTPFRVGVEVVFENSIPLRVAKIDGEYLNVEWLEEGEMQSLRLHWSLC